MMNSREDILKRIEQNQTSLRKLGVRRLAKRLFAGLLKDCEI